MTRMHHVRMGHVTEWERPVWCQSHGHVVLMWTVFMLGSSLGRPVGTGAHRHVWRHEGVTMAAVHTSVRHVGVMTNLAHRHGRLLVTQSTLDLIVS